jgi:hypothetical protein
MLLKHLYYNHVFYCCQHYFHNKNNYILISHLRYLHPRNCLLIHDYNRLHQINDVRRNYLKILLKIYASSLDFKATFKNDQYTN